MYRIDQHPILPIPPRTKVPFTWKGAALRGLRRRDHLLRALRRRHPHLRPSPQGRRRPGHLLRQRPVRPVPRPGRRHPGEVLHGARPAGRARRAGRRPARASPGRRRALGLRCARPIETIRVPVLIIGGGPAGLSAAIELGKRGIETLLIDDKHRLGGKLVLQTHRFFGSIDAVYAGTRGIDIATRLENEVRSLPRASGSGSRARPWPSSATRRSASSSRDGATSSSSRTSSSWRRAPGRRTWLSRATPCRASTAPAPSRRSSTGTWSGRRDGCSSSAAATSA